MSFLVLQGIQKRFGQTVAVEDFNLSAEKGEFVSFLGPSGCGKTTTLRMIAGFEQPSAGTITVGGTDITYRPANRRNVGMVFQSYALFPHMTVAENIGFGLKIRGVKARKRMEVVDRLLDMIGLNEQRNKKPRHISGGQQQRVAIARALAYEPEVLLFDESFSALDPHTRVGLRREIRQLLRKLRVPALFITHDQEEAMELGDHIAILNKGRLEQIGTPQEIYDRPRTMFVADFIGAPSMSFLGLQAAPSRGDRSIEVDGVPVQMPELFEDRPEGKFALGVRPENVSFADSSALRGSVIGAEYLGTTQIVTVTTASGRIKARLPSGKPVRVGENVGLALRADRLSLFDAVSGQALQSALYAGGQHG